MEDCCMVTGGGDGETSFERLNFRLKKLTFFGFELFPKNIRYMNFIHNLIIIYNSIKINQNTCYYTFHKNSRTKYYNSILLEIAITMQRIKLISRCAGRHTGNTESNSHSKTFQR